MRPLMRCSVCWPPHAMTKARCRERRTSLMLGRCYASGAPHFQTPDQVFILLLWKRTRKRLYSTDTPQCIGRRISSKAQELHVPFPVLCRETLYTDSEKPLEPSPSRTFRCISPRSRQMDSIARRAVMSTVPPGVSYTPRDFMPTKRLSTMSTRPMPLSPASCARDQARHMPAPRGCQPVPLALPLLLSATGGRAHNKGPGHCVGAQNKSQWRPPHWLESSSRPWLFF